MNMSKKILKNKKGISPVLAVLLMIAVAVAASLVTYAWVMGYLGLTTGRASHAIQIQSVDFGDGGDGWGGTNDTITIYTQNVGDGTVTITNVYLDGGLAVTVSTPIDEGDIDTLTILGQTLSAAQEVDIKVTCSDGTFTSGTYVVE